MLKLKQMKYFLLRFSHLRNHLLFSLTMDLLKKNSFITFFKSEHFLSVFLQLLFCFADGKFHDWKQMVWSRDLSFNTDYLPRKVKHSSRKKVVISIPQNVKEQSRVWLRWPTHACLGPASSVPWSLPDRVEPYGHDHQHPVSPELLQWRQWTGKLDRPLIRKKYYYKYKLNQLFGVMASLTEPKTKYKHYCKKSMNQGQDSQSFLRPIHKIFVTIGLKILWILTPNIVLEVDIIKGWCCKNIKLPATKSKENITNFPYIRSFANCASALWSKYVT